ncbi:uncharacterized protein LOC119661503, partial [Hermetia illucens]|uniref:uncharacterized protein LOC119661503 n=1 Tax=Hermetia illucens TaxID=343691 RepID=UPI0018CC68D4
MDKLAEIPAELSLDELSYASLPLEDNAKGLIQFNENSSEVVRCAVNERGILFVKVDCPTDEEPLEFTWSRDDIPIVNNDRFRITQTSKAVQLAIEHVQKDDTGYYTLYARTKSGETLRKDVELIAEDRSVGSDPPVFLRRLGDLSVKVGTRTRLLVEIRSSTELKVTWYRNDRRVCENDRIRHVHEGTFVCLEIAPVVLEDGGQWMCMAENLGGRNSCIALLNVLVPKAYKAPEFIEELRAILTEQGTVSLECKVIGIPTPILRWFKDSKEIKAGDVFALTANPDDPTSLGTYTCEAINCMGRAYSSSKVHVVGRGSREGSMKPADSVQYSAPPPIFTDELKDVKVKIGDIIILGCKVVVPPWPKIVSWYNKEGRVEASEKYRMIEDGLGVYMLEVKPSESCDEGEWKCVVTNNEGSVGISTCNVKMEIPKNYRKPRFMESLKAVLTEEGLVSFECKVVGFPTPILKWFKDGQELKPGDVYQLTGTNSLGTYCCVAKNCMGESSSVAVLTIEDIQNQLNDEERSFLVQQNQPPKFEIGLKSQDAKINEDFQFTIKVKATPAPLLTWFRDELPIESNEKYNIQKSEDGTCTLTINRAEFVDQAEWKCTASNDFGTSVTSCFLKLQIPRHYKKPRFLECLRAVLTEEGAVNLECKVIGVPQPVLKWYKDGVELKPGDIHRIISGQDGTCCLGTYTCEARNCMGIVASSASLLGFEDAYKNQNQEGFGEELQRNLSLSTIQEERTSQMYDTPVGDITLEEKGDVSFSFDGKEVSVSLYETPDLTEEEALQIVEMYADQISEHVTEHNVVELPPLRFVKETSQSGNLLMEAVVIDIAPDYFMHEEDMRTEAGMEDISINEVTVHQLSSGRDSFASGKEADMVEEMKSHDRKRRKSVNDQEEFYSLSHSKPSDLKSQSDDDGTETDLPTFASAQESINLSSHNAEERKISAEESAVDIAENKVFREDPIAPKRKKAKKGTDSECSKTHESLVALQDISGEAGDGLKLSRSLEPIKDNRLIKSNLEALVPIAKELSTIEKNLTAIEGEVIAQSAMMMSAFSAENSINIIANLLEPIRQIQSKMKVYSGEIPLDLLFETLEEDLKVLHRNLQVIEKCVEMDEGGRTLIQRTSVCIIDSCGGKFIEALENVEQIANQFIGSRLKNEFIFIVEDMKQGIQITQDTIKSQLLIQEASALETTKHFTESIAKLQTTPQPLPYEAIRSAELPPEGNALKNIFGLVTKMHEALEEVSTNVHSTENINQEPTQELQKTVFAKLSDPLENLEAEMTKLENTAINQVGQDSLEQKVNIGILDIVTPPLFELRKCLEAIVQQSTSETNPIVNSSMIDSMVLPIQEIQSGLAQLAQDIQSGQIVPDVEVDQPADTDRLTQSIAQAVLNFRSNAVNLAPRIDAQLHSKLNTLVDDVSKVVGEILNKPLDKYSLAILQNLKSPIDDLNYSLRQTEARSSSGSLRYLVEPLHNLHDRTKISEDILMLIGQNSNDAKVSSLRHVQKSVRNLERDIELLEAELLHQEILSQSKYAEEIEEPAQSLHETLTLPELQRNINRIAITLEELQTCIAGIQENVIQQSYPENVLTNLNKAQNCLSKIKNIAVLSTSREEELVGNVDLLQNASRPIRNAIESLQMITQPYREATLKDNTPALKSVSESLREIKDCVENNKGTTKLASPLTELESCLEEVVHKIATQSEDISTMEDISAMGSSLAESLDSPLQKKTRAQILLEELKQHLAGVSQIEAMESIANIIPLSHANDLQIAIDKVHRLEQHIAVIHSTDIQEPIVSVSSQQDLSSLETIAHRLNDLNSCIVQIQQEIGMENAESISSSNELKFIEKIATPLMEVRQSIEVIQNLVMEQTSKVPSEIVATEQVGIVNDLQSFVLAIQETHALDTVESLIEEEGRKELRAIVTPLTEIQDVINVQHQQHLSPLESITYSKDESIKDLEKLARPLLSLREAIEKLQDIAYDNYSSFSILRERATPVFQILEYVEKLKVDTLENALELSTQEDISALKTLAVCGEESERKVAVKKEVLAEKPIGEVALNECVNLLDACLVKLASPLQMSGEARAVIIDLSKEIQNLKKLFSSVSPDPGAQVDINKELAKALFSFREVLVHTYDELSNKNELVEILSDPLKTVEETLTDISQKIPKVERLFAEQILKNISENLNNFVAVMKVCDSERKLPCLEPLAGTLSCLNDALLSLNEVEDEQLPKNSGRIVRIQAKLMDTFRVFDGISESISNELLKPVLEVQNLLLSVNTFVESAESEISKAELLQEIELISKPLKEIAEIMEQPQSEELLIAQHELLKKDELDTADGEQGPIVTTEHNQTTEKCSGNEQLQMLVEERSEAAAEKDINTLEGREKSSIEVELNKDIFPQKILQNIECTGADIEVGMDVATMVPQGTTRLEDADLKIENTESEGTLRMEIMKLNPETQKIIETLEKVDMRSIQETIEKTLSPLIKSIYESDELSALRDMSEKCNVSKPDSFVSSLTELYNILRDKKPTQHYIQILQRLCSMRNVAGELDDKTLQHLKDNCPQFFNLLSVLLSVNSSLLDNIMVKLQQAGLQEIVEEQVDEGLRSLAECSAQIESLQCGSQEVSNILSPIQDSIIELKDSLLSLKADLDTNDTQESTEKVLRTLFKLKECLVHTYDNLSERTDIFDMLEKPLQDVELMLDDLMRNCPIGREKLTENIIGQSAEKVSALILIVEEISNNEKTNHWAQLVTPLCNLLSGLNGLNKIEEESIPRNSCQLIRFTTCLLEPFRALDDLRENVPLKLREPIVEVQNCLVGTCNFIENHDANIDRIDLLKKVELLAFPFEKFILAITKIMVTPILTDLEIAELVAPVKEAKLCLEEIQQKLTTGTEAECEMYLRKYGENIDVLKKQLERIESTILSKNDLSDLLPAEVNMLADIVPILEVLQQSLRTEDAIPSDNIERTEKPISVDETNTESVANRAADIQGPSLDEENMKPAQVSLEETSNTEKLEKQSDEQFMEIQAMKIVESKAHAVADTTPVEISKVAKQSIHQKEDGAETMADAEKQRVDTVEDSKTEMEKLGMNLSAELKVAKDMKGEKAKGEPDDITEITKSSMEQENTVSNKNEAITTTSIGSAEAPKTKATSLSKSEKEKLDIVPSDQSKEVKDLKLEETTPQIGDISEIPKENIEQKEMGPSKDMGSIEIPKADVAETSKIEQEELNTVPSAQPKQAKELKTKQSEIQGSEITEVNTESGEEMRVDITKTIGTAEKPKSDVAELSQIEKDKLEVIDLDKAREVKTLKPDQITLQAGEVSEVTTGSVEQKKTVTPKSIENTEVPKAEVATVSKVEEAKLEVASPAQSMEVKELKLEETMPQIGEISKVTKENIEQKEIVSPKAIGSTETPKAELAEISKIEKEQLEVVHLDEPKETKTVKPDEITPQVGELSEVTPGSIDQKEMVVPKSIETAKVPEAEVATLSKVEEEKLEIASPDQSKEVKELKLAETVPQIGETSEVTKENIEQKEIVSPQAIGSTETPKPELAEISKIEKEQLEVVHLDEPKGAKTMKPNEITPQVGELSEVTPGSIDQKEMVVPKSIETAKVPEAEVAKLSKVEEEKLEIASPDQSKEVKELKLEETMPQIGEISKVTKENIEQKEIVSPKAIGSTETPKAELAEISKIEKEQLEVVHLDEPKETKTVKPDEITPQVGELSEVTPGSIDQKEMVVPKSIETAKVPEAEVAKLSKVEEEKLEIASPDQSKEVKELKLEETMPQIGEISEVTKENIEQKETVSPKAIGSTETLKAELAEISKIEKEQLEVVHLDEPKEAKTMKPNEIAPQVGEVSEVTPGSIEQKEMVVPKSIETAKVPEAEVAKLSKVEEEKLEIASPDQSKEVKELKLEETMPQIGEISEVTKENIEQKETVSPKAIGSTETLKAELAEISKIEKEQLEVVHLDEPKETKTMKPDEITPQVGEASEVTTGSIDQKEMVVPKSIETAKVPEAEVATLSKVEEEKLEIASPDQSKEVKELKLEETMPQIGEISEVTKENIEQKETVSPKAIGSTETLKAELAEISKIEKEQLEVVHLDEPKEAKTMKPNEIAPQVGEVSEVTPGSIEQKEMVVPTSIETAKVPEAEVATLSKVEEEKLEIASPDQSKEVKELKLAETVPQIGEISEVTKENIEQKEIVSPKVIESTETPKAELAEISKIEKEQLEVVHLDEPKEAKTMQPDEITPQVGEASEVTTGSIEQKEMVLPKSIETAKVPEEE